MFFAALSLAMVLVFSISCYGCYRNTDLSEKLAERGLYYNQAGVFPILAPEKK